MNENWNDEMEELCEKVRINCVNLSEYHRNQYYYFKSYGKYFRIPVIILATINSTASVGLQSFMRQKWISLISCLIGMIIGIIGSMELYLSIQTNMDLEFKQSKEFYSLAVDIYKMLHIGREDRPESGKDYLNKTFNSYITLVEASNLLHKKLNVDVLAGIPKKLDYLHNNSYYLGSRTNSVDNTSDNSFQFKNIFKETTSRWGDLGPTSPDPPQGQNSKRPNPHNNPPNDLPPPPRPYSNLSSCLRTRSRSTTNPSEIVESSPAIYPYPKPGIGFIFNPNPTPNSSPGIRLPFNPNAIMDTNIDSSVNANHSPNSSPRSSISSSHSTLGNSHSHFAQIEFNTSSRYPYPIGLPISEDGKDDNNTLVSKKSNQIMY